MNQQLVALQATGTELLGNISDKSMDSSTLCSLTSRYLMLCNTSVLKVFYIVK